MKKYILLSLLFLNVFIGYSQNPEVNKTKPFSLEITATKDSNKPYSYLFNYKVVNNKKHPIIIKLGCLSTYDVSHPHIALIITNNDKRFLDGIMNKCIPNNYIVFRNKSFCCYKINFEHVFVDGEFKRHSTNNNFGTYSIQAIWYLPKDTIYSNIIELEYRKEE